MDMNMAETGDGLPSDVRVGLLKTDVDFVLNLRGSASERKGRSKLSASQSLPSMKSKGSTTPKKKGKVDEAEIRKQMEEAQARRVEQLLKLVAVLTQEHQTVRTEFQDLEEAVHNQERSIVAGEKSLNTQEKQLRSINEEIKQLRSQLNKREETNDQLEANIQALISKREWVLEQTREDQRAQGHVPSDLIFGKTSPQMLPEIDEARVEVDFFETHTLRSHITKLEAINSRKTKFGKHASK
jgi:chromosome segregation ATPase